MLKLSSIAFLALSFSNTALADARIAVDQRAEDTVFRLVYAQVQINDISQSDMRRLIFYADRATGTLEDLVNGANTRSIIDQDKVNTSFRASISRLADAGARTGLSMDQVADFYRQNVFDAYGQEFMQKVDNFAGGLDFRTLFRNVSTPARTSQNLEDDALMGALADASQDLQLTTPFSEEDQTQIVVLESDLPVALANATAVEVDIVKRIQVIDGRWELTIINGDSLSTIASAVYGDSLSYTSIYSANSAVISDPNIIEVGTRLVLPRR